MQRPARFLTLLAATIGLTSCAMTSQSAPTYTNPVLDADFPDPALLKASDDFFYAYATQGGGANIQVARSRDLVVWERLSDVLPVKPAWASKTQDFWAPHVVEADGRYFLYYSAKPDSALADPSLGLCLAVATSTKPEGPFVDSGRPLQCGATFVNIDPMPYDDPATGKRLLYWGSGFGPIKVQELGPDRVSFAAGSAPIDLVQPTKSDDPDDYQRLVEGAWVLQRQDWYYLFYSGDNCCGPKAHYAVLVARSRSATGPFETLAAATGAPTSVVLERGGFWVAPGHHSIVQDAIGDDWIVYHAVDTRRPRNKPTDEINSRRVMLLDRLVWRDGWPKLAAGGPTQTPQPRPRF